MARQLFGPVDMEFMIENEKPIILQLRMLDHEESFVTTETTPETLIRKEINSLEDLRDLLREGRDTDVEARCICLEFHDSLDFKGFQE
jgi:hypothetical protein